MSILIVLFGALVVYRCIGAAGVDYFTTWMVSARTALATMFLFTAASHFAPMRQDLIAMVPSSLPRPELLVFLTGIAELAGAVGFLVPGFACRCRCSSLPGRGWFDDPDLQR